MTHRSNHAEIAASRPPLYLLAGGRSSRFGSDKALAEHNGVPMLLSIASALSAAVSTTTVVADRAGKYDALGLRAIADQRRNAGPLAGLETALLDRLGGSGPGWLVLASCDLIDPSPAWLSRLIACITADAEAVSFRGDYWDPMPGLYHTALLPRVQRQLDDADRSMQHLLNTSNAAAVPLPRGMAMLPQANTPAALARHAPTGKEHA